MDLNSFQIENMLKKINLAMIWSLIAILVIDNYDLVILSHNLVVDSNISY